MNLKDVEEQAIKEYFQGEVEQGKADPLFVDYMAKHPKELAIWMEEQEEMRRMIHSY